MKRKEAQIFAHRSTDPGFAPESALVNAARCFARLRGINFPVDPGLTAGERGKPYFTAIPELHFSLSHSGEFWLAAIATTPLGLDIQQHQPCRREALARRFFHQQEQFWLERRDFDEESFFAVWTAKESYVKYTGQGIDDSFAAFSVIAGDALAQQLGEAQLGFLPFAPGYTVCLYAEEPRQVTFSFLQHK